MTQAEMARRFTEETGRKVEQPTVGYCAAQMGPHAKKKSMSAAQRDRRRSRRASGLRSEMTTLDASKLVFVDESGIRQGERAGYGYAFKGERCYETALLGTGRRRNLAWAGCGRDAGRWPRGQGRT